MTKEDKEEMIKNYFMEVNAMFEVKHIAYYFKKWQGC